MFRKIVLFLMVFTLSFQALSVSLYPEKTHSVASFSHDALHFWGEPHSHGAEDPAKIQLEFSAEARSHVAYDLNASSAVLCEHGSLKYTAVQTTPDIRWVQFVPEPFLHRITPPPRA